MSVADWLPLKAVSAKPHGIFGVDMTYDKNGVPNPTEINISRFFTTVLFFTEAGLNMPEIFKDIVLYNEFPRLKKKINPLVPKKPGIFQNSIRPFLPIWKSGLMI